MYETYYDKLQQYFGRESLQLYYIDTDAFVSSMNTKDIIKDLKNSEYLFDSSNLKKNHELFSNKNKIIGKFKIETPENIWIDQFVCLRSTAYSLKCGHDVKNKLQGISKTQTKHIKFEEYKKSLDAEEYQRECNIYLLRSINHDMYLQKVNKFTLSISDDKRCYINYNEIIPWG